MSGQRPKERRKIKLQEREGKKWEAKERRIIEDKTYGGGQFR